MADRPGSQASDSGAVGPLELDLFILPGFRQNFRDQPKNTCLILLMVKTHPKEPPGMVLKPGQTYLYGMKT